LILPKRKDLRIYRWEIQFIVYLILGHDGPELGRKYPKSTTGVQRTSDNR